jgi:hypothetical protein
MQSIITYWRNEQGQLHRLDGPAIEWRSIKEWYVNGIKYSKQDHIIAVVMFLLDCNEEAANLMLELFND